MLLKAWHLVLQSTNNQSHLIRSAFSTQIFTLSFFCKKCKMVSTNQGQLKVNWDWELIVMLMLLKAWHLVLQHTNDPPPFNH